MSCKNINILFQSKRQINSYDEYSRRMILAGIVVSVFYLRKSMTSLVVKEVMEVKNAFVP